MKETPEIERASLETIKEYQWEGLKKTLIYLNSYSKFYKNHFEKNGIKIENIKSLADLSAIPTISKVDLQKHVDEFYCVPSGRIIDYAGTSGTEGKAITIPLSENDLQRLAYNEMLSLQCAGGSNEDIYQLSTTVDRRFLAGLAYTLGARKLGAGMIRLGPGLPENQWNSIFELNPTALIIVPSFLLKMLEFARHHNIDFNKSSIKKAICIGEPIRNPDFSLNTLGNRIKENWPIDLYSTYASTEMATAFTECEAGKGGHSHPELIICEILNDSGEELADGIPGELTITTLGIEAMPLLRFRTGDICSKHSEICSCGRSTFRLGPIVGRKNQMIKYKGTSCYPPAIFELLEKFHQISHYQIEVRSNEFNLDEVVIYYSAPEELSNTELINSFKSNLKFTPDLRHIPENELIERIYTENSRKAIKFVDKRKSLY